MMYVPLPHTPTPLPFTNHTAQNEPYNFSHLLFISRTYRLTPEEESEMQQQQSASAEHPAKRQKGPSNNNNNNTNGSSNGVYPFHPEDEYIQKVRLP
jgi:protein BCP1